MIARRSAATDAAMLVLALVLAACGSTPTPAPTASEAGSNAPSLAPSPSGSPASSPTVALSPSTEPSAFPSPSATASPGANLLGTDGRLTVMLLGSDYRPAHPGNRTDAIIVVSLNPATGDVAAFSVPRDTTGFPLPGGGKFSGKVNALYQWYESRNGHGMSSMKQAISKAYGIEIDYGVLTGFAGVRQLVNAVHGVTVTLAKSYYDPEYWVNSHTQGWGLSAGTHVLTGNNALIFARSRKGDNDFNRSRRQQQLIAAAASKVTSIGPSILPQLLSIAKGTTRTDLPLTRALDLYAMVKTAKIAAAKTVVFGPRTYAKAAGGTSFSPILSACRSWIAKNFPKASPGAVWPASG
jgi:LCP family protein required for cell wall assembly